MSAEFIALCVVTGQTNGFVNYKGAAVGVKGDLDHDGEQRWFDSMETLLDFHPTLRGLTP